MIPSGAAQALREKIKGHRWTASTNSDGYPKVKIEGKSRLASHVLLEMEGRPVPPGKVVMHRDNDLLNLDPKNLRIGTQQQNLKQMRDEGRDRPRGVPQEPDVKKHAQEFPAITMDFLRKVAAGGGGGLLPSQVPTGVVGVPPSQVATSVTAVPPSTPAPSSRRNTVYLAPSQSFNAEKYQAQPWIPPVQSAPVSNPYAGKREPLIMQQVSGLSETSHARLGAFAKAKGMDPNVAHTLLSSSMSPEQYEAFLTKEVPKVPHMPLPDHVVEGLDVPPVRPQPAARPAPATPTAGPPRVDPAMAATTPFAGPPRPRPNTMPINPSPALAGVSAPRPAPVVRPAAPTLSVPRPRLKTPILVR